MTTLTPYYEQSTTCPLCQETFQTTKIRTRFVHFSGRDEDFCPRYTVLEYNPLLYHIHHCPTCHFSFSEETSSYFFPTSTTKIQELMNNQNKDYCSTRTYDQAIDLFHLAIECGKIKRETDLVIGGYYLRLAWIYRLLNQPEQERVVLLKTIQHYCAAYQKGENKSTKMTDVRLLYVIGEIYRRLEMYKEAVQYFSKVVEKKRETKDVKLVEMARDQWYSARQASKMLATSV
ncbi:hypothetical protein Q73_12075 [Bacillus coahuilensis m2-6]|uniref:Uncharacterized protein n=1 Tax=Bacillus coahuilensis p1.1.43 TaxID=1150625 RepID=A0A147K6B1_9BACI|nr:DUF2225 domain-containing protein [Bacillus coahuilensis]KUP05370.1 hypothetical protein Q75_12675 [Bacillus coahuilensis p1.1.43]KUP06112.1 hypothetical protein Q73_12075 [Bacillus coahuilensis m2-6]